MTAQALLAQLICFSGPETKTPREGSYIAESAEAVIFSMISVIGTEEDAGVAMVGTGRPRSLDRERSDLSEKMMMQ
jgi:hypothetical protein